MVIDFKPKHRLAYQLPTVALWQPIKAKSQANEKKIVRENIKVLKIPLPALYQGDGRASWNRPFCHWHEVKPAVGSGSIGFPIWRMIWPGLGGKDVRIEAPIPGKSWSVSRGAQFRSGNRPIPNSGNSPRLIQISFRYPLGKCGQWFGSLLWPTKMSICWWLVQPVQGNPL